MRHILSVCLLLLCWHPSQAINTIAIDASPGVLENSITRITLADVSKLLAQACNCTVQYGTTGDVVLKLPSIDTTRANQPSRFSKNFTQYPYLQYPDHDYTWSATTTGSTLTMALQTPSYQGIAFGLYGLLQEELGFRFYHPRETIIPVLTVWPLADGFKWEAKARFDKKGFHLHTMHPIELTQQLLNHEFEGGIEQVKEYLDWLVRNGQNYFEFNLLEGVSRKHWPAYAQQYVDYGKSRGIIMGVDVSLHMLQQNAYKLYEGFPKSWRPKQKQIDRNLDWLMALGWDVVNMEFSSTEFSEGNVTKKEQQRLHITDVITNKYGAKLMGRKHVVKKDNMAVGSKVEGPGYVMNAEEKQLDANRGILIHTVMFYTATEESAPVYGNENLRHMQEELRKEIKQRETWYYPESAYWITFDNSIPMYLLPYLGARLDDIDTMAKMGVPGHVTFSSGWEWGYWTIDWSIARWSWEHTVNNQAIVHKPTEYLEELFGKEVGKYFAEQHKLQQVYLKDKNLMQYMVAMNITDEVASAQLHLPFHPRPRWMYRYLRYKADQLTLDSVRNEGVKPLQTFYAKSLVLDLEYGAAIEAVKDSALRTLLNELVLALDVTGLRAQHRATTIEGLLRKREAELNGTSPKKAAAPLLLEAQTIRLKGVEMVQQMEGHYRYPVWLLARPHWSHTVYYFGYLYTTSNLHFWLREEKQISNDRYGPFYRNIWNILRTVGAID
ncbi:hypothetical protein BH09BAC1_BH09BAC1_02880 [soil metagenome]